MDKLPNELKLQIMDSQNIFEIIGLCKTNKSFQDLCSNSLKHRKFFKYIKDIKKKHINNPEYMLPFFKVKSFEGLKFNEILVKYTDFYYKSKYTIHSLKNYENINLNLLEDLFNRYKFTDYRLLNISFLPSDLLKKIDEKAKLAYKTPEYYMKLSLYDHEYSASSDKPKQMNIVFSGNFSNIDDQDGYFVNDIIKYDGFKPLKKPKKTKSLQSVKKSKSVIKKNKSI